MFNIFPCHTAFSQKANTQEPYAAAYDLPVKSKYSYYESPLQVTFRMVPSGVQGSVTGELFSLVSADGMRRQILLDWDGNDGRCRVFFNTEHRTRRHILDSVDLNSPVNVSVSVYFNEDMIKLGLNGETITVKGTGLLPDEGYIYHILPVLSSSQNPDILPAFNIEELAVTAKQVRSGRALWGYLILLLANLTILVSLFIHHRIRKQKGGRTKDDILDSATFNTPEMPLTSAIYIFGGLKVYNRAGENIAKQLSPTLSQLLSLLILNSDKQGIPSSNLIGILWSDMTPENARNNRAVCFSKLRRFLEEVGDIAIENNGRYWKINGNNVFVDYLYYKEKMNSPEKFSENNIGGIISVARNGNILPEMDYIWLDDLKSEISNNIMDRLIVYGESDAVKNNPAVYYAISDVISRLDRFNEDALVFRCKAYVILGRHQSAKNYYDRFCAEYRSVYGEDYPIVFTDIVK